MTKPKQNQQIEALLELTNLSFSGQKICGTSMVVLRNAFG